jgi:hypothetical protein
MFFSGRGKLTGNAEVDETFVGSKKNWQKRLRGKY